MTLSTHGAMVLHQIVAVLLVRRVIEYGLGPQIGSQVRVRLSNGSVGCLGYNIKINIRSLRNYALLCKLTKVAQGACATTGCSVAIFNTGHLEKFLRNGGRDDASSSGAWNETHQDGTALACNLARDGVGFTDLVTPVTTTNWNDRELGQNNGTTNSSGNFFWTLDSQTNMTIVITNSCWWNWLECENEIEINVKLTNKSLEASTLTSSGLFLDRHDLQYLILKSSSKEEINDLELLRK